MEITTEEQRFRGRTCERHWGTVREDGLARRGPPPGMRRGEWTLVVLGGWPDNRSCEPLLAWTWSSPHADHLVRLPSVDPGTLTMADQSSGARDGDAVCGLFVALPGGGAHVLHWRGPPHRCTAAAPGASAIDMSRCRTS